MTTRPAGIAVLGSTGSIGRQALDIIASLPDRFQVIGLSAGSNRRVLEEQARLFNPSVVHLDELEPGSAPIGPAWASMEEMATHPDVDVLFVGTTGKVGLLPALAALETGKAVALANKEALVMAGHLLTAAAETYGGRLNPVDSEHSAIWQCLWGEEQQNHPPPDPDRVRRRLPRPAHRRVR